MHGTDFTDPEISKLCSDLDFQTLRMPNNLVETNPKNRFLVAMLEFEVNLLLRQKLLTKASIRQITHGKMIWKNIWRR